MLAIIHCMNEKVLKNRLVHSAKCPGKTIMMFGSARNCSVAWTALAGSTALR